MQRLLRLICEEGFEHHVAANFSESASSVYEAASNYLDWNMYHHEPEKNRDAHCRRSRFRNSQCARVHLRQRARALGGRASWNIRCTASAKTRTSPRSRTRTNAGPGQGMPGSNATAAISGACDCGNRTRYNGVERNPGRCQRCNRSANITCGAIIAQSQKRKRSRTRTEKTSKRSSGAAVCIRMSGASPKCCTGCAITLRSGPSLPALSNIAIWRRPRLPASTIPRRLCEVSAAWDISGCGTRGGVGFRRRNFWSALDPLLDGIREKLQSPVRTSDHLAGHLSSYWAEQFGLKPGIPIPVGAFDAHWDAVGAGIREGDVVNVIGTSTCIIAISRKRRWFPAFAALCLAAFIRDLPALKLGSPPSATFSMRLRAVLEPA